MQSYLLPLNDQYENITKIGSGGFGNVYKAHNKYGKPEYVAIKIIDFYQLLNTPGFYPEDLENEALSLKSLSSLSNCNKYVACYIDHFTVGEKIYLVQEYIQGPTLQDIINSQKDMEQVYDIDDIWITFLELVEILNYIHSNGYAHKDIKSTNIIYDEVAKHFKFVDFGLACSKNIPCKEGQGTMEYAPPEINDSTNLMISQAGDIWSLGVTFYQLIHQKFMYSIPPFTKKFFSELPKVNYTQPSNQKYLNTSVNYVVNWMLQFDWMDRPSASMLLRYLEEDTVGCIIEGKIYYRPRIVKALNNMNMKYDPDQYLAQLCHLYYDKLRKDFSFSLKLDGGKKDIGIINIIPTTFNSLNQKTIITNQSEKTQRPSIFEIFETV